MNEFRVKHCYGFHGKVVTEFFDCAPAPLQVEQLASSPGTEKSSRCLQDLCSQNCNLHISFIGIQRPLRLSLCLCPYLSPKSPKWPRTIKTTLQSFISGPAEHQCAGDEAERLKNLVVWGPQMIETFMYTIDYYCYISLSPWCF